MTYCTEDLDRTFVSKLHSEMLSRFSRFTYTNSYAMSVKHVNSCSAGQCLRISPRLATVKTQKRQLVAVQAPGRSKGLLTKELLQLHDAGIGPNAMDRLHLLGIRTALLENFAVSTVWIMLVRHDVVGCSFGLDLLMGSLRGSRVFRYGFVRFVGGVPSSGAQ